MKKGDFCSHMADRCENSHGLTTSPGDLVSFDDGSVVVITDLAGYNPG